MSNGITIRHNKYTPWSPKEYYNKYGFKIKKPVQEGFKINVQKYNPEEEGSKNKTVIQAIEDGYKNTDKICDDNLLIAKIPAIKKAVESIDREIVATGIDTKSIDGKMQVMAFLYGQLQKDIKYYNPQVRVGNWMPNYLQERATGLEDGCNVYGALVDKYAKCSGIAKAFEVLCNHYGIACTSRGLTGVRVGHAINEVSFDNGKVSYIDIASEIGMGQDGLYADKNTIRRIPIEKLNITTRYFMMSKEDVNRMGYTFDEEPRSESQKMSENEKLDLFSEVDRKIANGVNGTALSDEVPTVASGNNEMPRITIHNHNASDIEY